MKRKLETNVSRMVVEGKKSPLKPICKVRLKNGNEQKNKFLEHLSILMEDCQAFGLPTKKAENVLKH